MIQHPQIFGGMMSNLYWLSEEQMGRLVPYFAKRRGKPRVDDRRVLSGIIFIIRNGLRWCDAPPEYGPPKTLYNRWNRWSDMGVFARIMTGLATEAPDNETISIPSHRNFVSTAGQRARPISRLTARPQVRGSKKGAWPSDWANERRSEPLTGR